MKIEKLEEIAKAAKVGSQELPEVFEGTVVAVKDSYDEEYDRPAILVDIDIGDGVLTTVKWTPYHLRTVLRYLKDFGLTELKEGQRFKFRKTAFGIGYPRPVPIEYLGERK